MDAAQWKFLLCVLLIALGSCLQHAAAQADSLASTPAGGSSSLFLPVAESPVAAASVSPQNLQISEKVVTTATETGGEPQPVMQVVELNLPLLTRAPRRLRLNLPGGTTVTAIRRADLSRLASSVQVTPMKQRAAVAEAGAALLWAGEVTTARGGLSSVVLIQSENGGLYGNIRYLDRKEGRIRTFKVFPLILQGADPVTAAAMPDFAPASVEVSLAALYPSTHPTKHIILEYEEPEPSHPTPEQEEKLIYNGPPEAANAKPATVDTTPKGATATPEPLVVISSDASTLAASIAAGAGPDAAAALGPEGFQAAAASVLQALSAQAAAAPPAPLAPVGDAPPAAGAAAYPNSTAVGGRRLQQSLNPAANTRQDILLLYTALAATRAGGVTALEAAVRARIVETNKAYADSGAAIDLVLVGVRQVDYAQSTSSDLGAQLDTALNAMRANPAWLSGPRNELGADFVQLWIGTQSPTPPSSFTCGIGYVPSSPTNVPALLSAVNNFCFSGFTLAHEVGHNQGCFHETGNVQSAGPAYSAGWKRCDLSTRTSKFNTIMAYSCSGGSTRVAYLSTPSITVSGVPAGSVTQGHCARRITETAASRAGVFTEKVSGPFAALTSQVNSNKCLDAWKYVQGTQVAINDCSTTRSYQRWERTPDGLLRSPSTIRCMQVSATVTSGASVVQIWECTSTLSQQWFNDRLGRLHPYSTPARCLTLPSSTTTNGQGLTVTDCINTAPTPSNQRWNPSTAVFPAVFNPQNNRLQSALAAAPQCIDNLAYNTTNGAAVVMMPCNNNATTSTNQRWSLTDAGQLQLMFNTAKCMTAVGTGVKGDVIRLSDCVNGGNQRWFMDSLSRLRPYHAPNKCMDIVGASTAQQATLQLFDCLDANQQKWTVIT